MNRPLDTPPNGVVYFVYMTENQKELLKFISWYRLTHRNSPTLREMVSGIKVSDNKSILGIIAGLTKNGFLMRGDGKSRSILLTDQALEFLGTHSLPLKYEGYPSTLHMKQSADLMNNSVTVTSPTSDGIYADGKIKTDGTNLQNDIRVVVETAVALVIDRWFNGTSGATPDSKQTLAKGVGSVLNKLLEEHAILQYVGWAILLSGLLWLNIFIIGNSSATLTFVIIEAFVIKNLLIVRI